MTIILCEACNKEFTPQNKTGRFCSRACANIGRFRVSLVLVDGVECKSCVECKEVKPLSSFSVSSSFSGYKRKCKSCASLYMRKYYEANPDKYSRQKEYVKDNDQKYKRSNLRHGLTEPQLDDMVAKYEGKCWSCKIEPWYGIDHDHSCCPGSWSCGDCVRGLLCNGCNTSLGLLRENPQTILRLVEYLATSVRTV